MRVSVDRCVGQHVGKEVCPCACAYAYACVGVCVDYSMVMLVRKSGGGE